MKPFNVLFEEQKSDEIIYKGRCVRRRIVYKDCKRLNLKFSEVTTNSKYPQTIVLLFSNDFNGKIFLNGSEYKLPKKPFAKINFWTDTMPSMVEVEIFFKSGFVSICNGADPIGNKQLCRMLTAGAALILIPSDNDSYIVRCNDFENDDDFEDLIFKMQVIVD